MTTEIPRFGFHAFVINMPVCTIELVSKPSDGGTTSQFSRFARRLSEQGDPVPVRSCRLLSSSRERQMVNPDRICCDVLVPKS